MKDSIIQYLGISLPLLYNEQDPVHCHGRNSRVKYVRIVNRTFNGKDKYFAQLICEGVPIVKKKNTANTGIVGIDIGPQTIAIVSKDKNKAKIQVFTDEIQQHKVRKRNLERSIARKIRSGNPACYQEDRWVKKDKNWIRKKGKSMKGKWPKNRSNALKKTIGRLANLARKQAAHRKSQHGHLVNEILQIGNHIKAEKLSYKSFQKLYGKSVGLRAPGMFVEHLRRKAENAGGQVEDISTWKTKLSQTCHCGIVHKKSLSDRWHNCECGVKAQRDLYSDFLACFVKKNVLIADQAQKAWSGMDIALHTAMRKLKQSISEHQPTSLGLSRVVDCRV